MLNEEKLLLWVFVASDDQMGELNHTYAHTENEARAQLSAWMAAQVVLGREKIEVKHWPDGFRPGHRAYWPGSIPASQVEGTSHAATTAHH